MKAYRKLQPTEAARETDFFLPTNAVGPTGMAGPFRYLEDDTVEARKADWLKLPEWFRDLHNIKASV